MRKPVTSDKAVLDGWPKKKDKPIAVSSAAAAKALGITVFQITARLKGMQVRGLLERDKDGNWKPTGKEAAPPPVHTPSARRYGAGLPAVGLPDDSKVPLVVGAKWGPSLVAIRHAEKNLPIVRDRMKEYTKDAKRYKRELAALAIERNHCENVLGKRKSVWTYDYVPSSTGMRTVYIHPDGRKFVSAKPFETADLIMDKDVVGLKSGRLKLYEKSITVRKEEKSNKEQERREEAKKEDAKANRLQRESERKAQEREAAAAAKEARRAGKGNPPPKTGPAKGAAGSAKSGHKALPRKGGRISYAALVNGNKKGK
jgi:hypothetical protein